MQLGTAVFHRIVEEAKQKGRDAAVRAVADTMEETYRFGWARREYIEECARKRLEAALDGKPWPPRA